MTGKNLIAGTIPEGALGLHVIVLGKTRSGKSSKARLIVEHCLERGEPVGIIDPKGDWWGIKLSASGKSAGYPVVIFGGEHADVKINEHSGAAVADLVASGNRPFLIDLGGWMPAKRTRFFVDFASAFFLKTRGKRVLMIDEVHNFAPQGKVLDPDSGKALHWANRLASEGGGKGLTLISASQRPQKVHKDYVTSHETLIACKVIHKLDRDAVKDWIDGCGDPEQGKEVFKTLGSLPKPRAWVWCPEIAFGPSLVTFPIFKTYDSFKPQEEGDAAKLKGWASVDLDEVNQKLAAVIAEEAAKDPAKLRADLAAANAKIKLLESKAPTAPAATKADLEAAEKRGLDRGRVAGEAETAPVWFRRGVEHMAQHIAQLSTPEIVTYGLKQFKNVGALPIATPSTKTAARHAAPVRAILNLVDKAESVGFSPNGSSSALPSAARKMLSVLDTNPPVRRTWTQVASLAGLKARGGSYNTAKKALVESGLIAENGGLVEIGTPSASVPSGNLAPADMVEMWAKNLASGPSRILRHLYSVGGIARTQEIAEALNLQPRGGSWNTAWKELRDNDIVVLAAGQAELTELFRP